MENPREAPRWLPGASFAVSLAAQRPSGASLAAQRASSLTGAASIILPRVCVQCRRLVNASIVGGSPAACASVLSLALFTPTQEMHTMLAGCARLMLTPPNYNLQP